MIEAKTEASTNETLQVKVKAEANKEENNYIIKQWNGKY